MELRILGPVELLVDGQSVFLARRQQRLILGILAMEANRLVSRTRLIDLIWSSRPPQQARAVLQTRVSEIRSALNRHLDGSQLL
jgi:DNA-binding SARP family transcriptional activator